VRSAKGAGGGGGKFIGGGKRRGKEKGDLGGGRCVFQFKTSPKKIKKGEK